MEAARRCPGGQCAALGQRRRGSAAAVCLCVCACVCFSFSFCAGCFHSGPSIEVLSPVILLSDELKSERMVESAGVMVGWEERKDGKRESILLVMFA